MKSNQEKSSNANNYEESRSLETGENILYVSTPNKDGSFNLTYASKNFKPSASMYKLIKRQDNKYDAYLVGDNNTERYAYSMPGTYLSPLIEGVESDSKGIPYKIIKPAIINSDGTLFEKGKFGGEINEEKQSENEKLMESNEISESKGEESIKEDSMSEKKVELNNEELPKNEDGWTKEDEKTLENLLQTIEEVKKELETLAELKKGISKNEKSDDEKINKIEKKEIKNYSIDFIKKEIENILSKITEIKKIESLDISGHENNIKIKGVLKAKKGFIPVTVKIEATLGNEGGEIKLDNYNLEAGILKPVVESLVKPKLNKISELIKEYIEKEEKQKVGKIWIENGELKAL